MVAGCGEGAILTRILTVGETGSTNADLLALAADGAEEALWLRAERQTAGRGRQGRDWQSPPGNLYASTIVRLRPGDPPPATLALVAAVAVVDTLALLGFADVTIKWPNDLLIDGAKFVGILLERSGDAVVVGIGINLATSPVIDGRAIANLAGRLHVHTPGELLDHLAELFAAWLARWRETGLPAVIAVWQRTAHPTGTPLVANLPDGSAVTGSFAGLAADGALRLRLANGDVRVIHAADVFLV